MIAPVIRKHRSGTGTMKDFFLAGRRLMVAALAGLALQAAPLAAQTIDGDLTGTDSPDTVATWNDPYPDPEGGAGASGMSTASVSDPGFLENGTPIDGQPTTAAAEDTSTTYKQDDLIGAAEGVFGKGAEGLARMIESWLEKQGEPNAYIVGREGGGAVVVGLRYGSGTMFHKVEGERPVYWTGPSVGFDLGANASNTFVLVYNLFDTDDIYKRFPAAEGQAYIVGGFHASYLRRGDIVLIPIRMGAGLRLGVNAGYMKIREKQRWIPF